MQVTRFKDARRYDAPKHFDMRSLRLQGFDVTDSKVAWVGLSHFLPGGGAEMDAGPTEKIYVVLSGDIEQLGRVDRWKSHGRACG